MSVFFDAPAREKFLLIEERGGVTISRWPLGKSDVEEDYEAARESEDALFSDLSKINYA